MAVAEGPRYSPDGRWYWDGLAWQPLSPAPAAPPQPYIPPGTLATLAITLIGVTLAGYMFVLVNQIVMLAAALGLVGRGVRVISALISLPGGLVFLGGLVGAAITVPMWMYQSSRNLRALGSQAPRWSPGLAAASWFVPFANLAIPYIVLHQLETRTSLRGEQRSPFLWLSWTFWVGAWACAGLLLAVALVTGGQAVVVQAGLITVGELSWMLAWALVIPVIRLIVQAQEASVRRARELT